MALRQLLPFAAIERRGRKRAQTLSTQDAKVLPKLFRAIGLAVGYTGGTYSIGFNRVNFEPAPYDFDRVIQAIDTDSYVKQAFNKYKELIWKEGWTITSDNEEAVEYLRMRIQFMELAMERSFDDFLVDVGDQMTKFANGFVVKVRGDLGNVFPTPLKSMDGTNPVVGFELLPAETMEIMRDYRNNPVQYRQNIWGAHGFNAPSGFGRGQKGYANLLPQWRPSEVIHFAHDVKPGRLFGTPFVITAMDDVVALRQIEEDIQNLIHRELFPLYKYMVGTEDHPAEPEEIENAARELAGLRTEGGLVLPDRHDVEVIGAEGKAMDATGYLDHFKERVAIGLGLSQHHLGMMSGAGNRTVSDRLDVALYDKVKLFQKQFANIIKLRIFDELLLEGGFDPYIPHSKKSDACRFVFNEIDVDTQVKKENHVIQKWISDMITLDEARLAFKMPPEVSEDDLYTAMSMRMQPAPGTPVKPADGGSKPAGSPVQAKNPLNPSANKPPSLTSGGAKNAMNKPDGQAPSKGGAVNKSAGPKKGISNRSMPSNQTGRNMSPDIRHSDDTWITMVEELLTDESEELDV